MAKRCVAEIFNVSEAFEKVNLETLRPLAKFVSPDAPTRKMDIVPYLTQTMTREDMVRRLYEKFGDLPKAAIQEAVADPEGRIDTDMFKAKYGEVPDEGTRIAPTRLSLFFPLGWYLPEDLRTILEKFVPEPRPVSIDSSEELPATVPEQIAAWRTRQGERPAQVPLRQRSTAPVALGEFATMLRLLESGKIRVSDKTRKPSQATVEAIAPYLVDGDYYLPEERSADSHDPGSDLAIRSFAWPCILQAAGLISLSGGKLGLSPAGRKALGQPAQEGIRTAWNKWISTSLFDEFERVDAIKGKQSARLSAVADRRRAVSSVLEECPAGRWIAIDEFFRFLRAQDENFVVARNVWKLYFAEHHYGNFADGHGLWELLQGRFIMAMLCEYAATLGLIDIAYIAPQFARNDFRARWGTDELDCLSRYDGLEFFRINELGAWCLDRTPLYQPEDVITKRTWRVLPNHDVVSSELNADPADAMFLDRVADRTSDRVWRLDRDKILTAVEDGLTLDAIDAFLENHGSEPTPQTVQTFLADLREKAERLRDKGTVRMIECADAETAQMLVLDVKLKALCMPAGERNLVFSAADESAVRARLRKLGHVMPSRE
ncbi:MAG: hypothetical protein ACHRXM_06995 [Isosphaerales bacterium]